MAPGIGLEPLGRPHDKFHEIPDQLSDAARRAPRFVALNPSYRGGRPVNRSVLHARAPVKPPRLEDRR